MRPDQIAAARKSKMLQGLPDDLAMRLLHGAAVRRFAAGETIFLQGEEAHAIFIIIDGWVKLYRMSGSGAEAVVSVLTKNRSFAEAVALRGVPYPVSAEAITDASVIQIETGRLLTLIQQDPKIAITLLSATYLHLQNLVEQVEQLKARSGVQRVAEFLVELADCQSGACQVSLPYNKALIAGHLGMKPESLSRAFARLREYGVRVSANTANLSDIEALRALAAEDKAAPWMK